MTDPALVWVLVVLAAAYLLAGWWLWEACRDVGIAETASAVLAVTWPVWIGPVLIVICIRGRAWTDVR